MPTSHHSVPNARDRIRKIRAVLAEGLPDEETLQRVTAVLAEEIDETPQREPVELNERGWPILPDPDPVWTDTGTGPGHQSQPDEDPHDPRD